MLTSITFIITLSVYILYRVTTRKFDYWRKKNVVFAPPIPFFGNYSGYILLKENLLDVVRDLCNLYPKEPYIGAFYGTEPTLIIQDPEFIKLVLTKDFYYFNGREGSKYTDNEIITQNPFFTYGDKWKVIRQNLTPLFSSSKMRNMFHLIEKRSEVFEDLLEKESLADDVDVRSLMSRFTMDCIGSCTFGVDPNTMTEPKNNKFRTMGYLFFASSTSRGIKNVVKAIWPGIFYGLGFKAFPEDITNFFKKLLLEIFEVRKNKRSKRNDFIDLVLNLKENKYFVGDPLKNVKEDAKNKIEIEVNDDLLVAQCTAFFVAGFETSATISSLTLFELAKSVKAQKRAQAEVDKYVKKYGDKINYDCVAELPFLNACLDEALRLYPTLGVLTREVMAQYTFPTGLTVDKGVRIHIPVYHMHHDPKNFPEPEMFKPERFYGQAKNNIKSYTYLPFGGGPRTCIGMRFAKMQMVAGLLIVLKNYNLTLGDRMSETIELEPKAIVTQPNTDVRLKLVPRISARENNSLSKT